MLVAGKEIAEPGDRMRGWSPTGESSPIEGNGGEWYDWNTQPDANGVRFDIEVFHNSPSWKYLMDLRIAQNPVPIVAVMKESARSKYPTGQGIVFRMGAKRCMLKGGEGHAGVNEAQRVVFNVEGIDRVLETL